MLDKSLSPEIQKLMEKIMKNPASRLFVPLGEEYLKAGMIDEAVQVLAEGIERHPTYVAARVMLGKIYLSQDRIPEAEKEFGQVILINPENILAHKKLASIFQKRGAVQKAIESCKKVLTIDPLDKEAKELIVLLEKEQISTPPAETIGSLPSPPVEEVSTEEVFPTEQPEVTVSVSTSDHFPKVNDDTAASVPVLSAPGAFISLGQEVDEKVPDCEQGIPDPTKEASFQPLQNSLLDFPSEDEPEDEIVETGREAVSVGDVQRKKIERLQTWLETIRKKAGENGL